MRTLGIDIGGSSVKVALLEDGKPFWRAQGTAYSRPDTSALIRNIREVTHELTADFGAVGICVPGILDQSKESVAWSVNVPGLNGVRLAELLKESLGKTISVLQIVNDAHAAGIDIAHATGLKGRLLVIALGTGVGCAVLDDGAALTVEGDSPGHLGQMDVSLDDSPPMGPDGGAGSLEAYIGAPAIILQYGSVDRFLKSVRTTDSPSRALARAIRICHAIYRPDHVVLAGGIGIRLKRLIGDLKAAVDQNLTRIARPDWTLHAGEHDFHAAFGAARIAAMRV